MSVYSIRDLERISGIRAHTIRIWEQRYGLFSPARSRTNIRSYSDNDLRRLLNIAFLLSCGEKISRLANLGEREIRNAVVTRYERITGGGSSHTMEIDAFRTAMLQLDESSLEGLFSACIRRYGLKTAMLQLVYPLLRDIGIMWCTEEIDPSFEHFISNFVRQKLFTAIDGLGPAKKDAKKYLLFLPEGEYHEIPLLFANYLLRAEGRHTLYLGQNVPLSDLRSVAGMYGPDRMLSIILGRQVPENFFAELEALGIPAYIGGNITDIPAGVKRLGELDEALPLD